MSMQIRRVEQAVFRDSSSARSSAVFFLWLLQEPKRSFRGNQQGGHPVELRGLQDSCAEQSKAVRVTGKNAEMLTAVVCREDRSGAPAGGILAEIADKAGQFAGAGGPANAGTHRLCGITAAEDIVAGMAKNSFQLFGAMALEETGSLKQRVLSKEFADHLRYLANDGLQVEQTCAWGVQQTCFAGGPAANQAGQADERIRAEEIGIEKWIIDASDKAANVFTVSVSEHKQTATVSAQLTAVDTFGNEAACEEIVR